MIEVPFIMGGSWFFSSERRVRSLFHVAIVVKEVNEHTQDIAKQLADHYSHNKNYSTKVFVDNAIDGPDKLGAGGANIILYLLNENSCHVKDPGSRFVTGASSFNEIDKQVGLSYNYFLLGLAIKQVCGENSI